VNLTRRWLVVLVPGLLLYLAPLPGLSPAQRHLLAIFTATVIALVAQPVAMGVTSIVALTLLALTRSLTTAQVFSGFSNPTVWLIFTAFLFATAVTSTRFGMRVAYIFIRRFGRSPLMLGYSVAGADLVLAPFVPSDTARGGGIVCPVVTSIARAVGSEPGETADELGGFLTLAGFHTTYTASAMFLTGMAANPVMADLARRTAGVELTWITWAVGAIVPGLLALAIVPAIILRLHPPRLRDTEPARVAAADALRMMGPMAPRETRLVVILLLVMAGWVLSPWHGVSNTIVALAGVSALLLARVITWDELLAERKAWEALIWFGTLVMMADSLLQTGVVDVLSKSAFGYVQSWPGVVALAALVTAYQYIHYGFATMTAQASALYAAFLAAAVASGSGALVSALALAYFSNVNAAMTHYGTGSAPVFFGAGYVSQSVWWRVGFFVSIVNLGNWLGVGLLWWRVLGWW
jgi:DASS family divalent anion:Na+ symporter